jgi:hypothetical protein
MQLELSFIPEEKNIMLAKQHFSTEQAREFGDKFGSDWDWSYSNADQLSRESGIESESGLNSPFADEPGKLPFARRNRNRSSQRGYKVRHTGRNNPQHK